jgi:hypothetical protein
MNTKPFLVRAYEMSSKRYMQMNAYSSATYLETYLCKVVPVRAHQGEKRKREYKGYLDRCVSQV